MKVLRIESINGYGPFTEYCGGLVVRYGLPGPYNDGIESICENEYCGVVTWNQLFSWFPELITEDSGWFLVEYEIDSNFVKIGYTQVVFDREKATKTWAIPLKDIC